MATRDDPRESLKNKTKQGDVQSPSQLLLVPREIVFFVRQLGPQPLHHSPFAQLVLASAGVTRLLCAAATPNALKRIRLPRGRLDELSGRSACERGSCYRVQTLEQASQGSSSRALRLAWAVAKQPASLAGAVAPTLDAKGVRANLPKRVRRRFSRRTARRLFQYAACPS